MVEVNSGLTRIPREIVLQALKTVPASFTLTPRNPARALNVGGNHISFSLVAGPPNVHDCVNGRRSGNHADYVSLIKLAQSFDIIHFIGNQPTAPQELPARTRHLDCYLANILYSDRVFHCTAIGRERALDGIDMMAITRGLTREQMADESRRPHHHLGQFAAPLRCRDERRPDGDVGIQPGRGGDALHLDGRDGAGVAGRGAHAAECRGARRHHALAAGAARRAGGLWRLHLRRRHEIRRARLRHAGECARHAGLRPAGALLQDALPRQQLQRQQRGRRPGGLRIADVDLVLGPWRTPISSITAPAGWRAD